jgi:hypothetical protein
MIMNALIVTLSIALQAMKILEKTVKTSSVTMMLGLSEGTPSEGMAGLEYMDAVLPRGPLMLTLRLAAGDIVDGGDLGRGIPAGEICNLV